MKNREKKGAMKKKRKEVEKRGREGGREPWWAKSRGGKANLEGRVYECTSLRVSATLLP